MLVQKNGCVKMDNGKETKVTNVWDFLIYILNWTLNLLKLEKVICIVLIYILIRDGIILSRIEEGTDISSLLIDTRIINAILINDNSLITALCVIIAILLTALLIVVFFSIPMYKKEIDRLSSVRSDLMHDKGIKKLRDHNSSIEI